MTFSQIVKDIFSRKPKKNAQDNSKKGRSKAFLSKMSGAFMLPISVMAIAGLFLGVGAAIDSHTSAKTLGSFIKALGDPIFGSMPALFAVAIIIAFTDEAGIAVFAGIVAFVVFSAIQGPFIDAVSTNDMKDKLDPTTAISNDDISKYGITLNVTKDGRIFVSATSPDLSSKVVTSGVFKGFTEYFDKNTKRAIFYALPSGSSNSITLGGHVFTAGEMVNANFDKSLYDRFGTPSNNTGFAYFLGIHTSDNIASHVFNLSGKNWGITSLNTSIFGGICVGALVAFLYNRFHVIELPGAIAFFGGKRFVAIISMVMVIPLAFIFLLIWPWVGLGLAYFGEYSGKVAGLDSFIFGYVERALIPFGLHHVFYAPLWWTNAGGDVISQLNKWNMAGGSITAIDGVAGKTVKDFATAIENSNGGNYMGDSFGWLALNGTSIKTITFRTASGAIHTEKLFDFVSDQLGLRFGRFMQGKYSFMQFGLPAAGAAMIFAAPKEYRKDAFSVVFAASLTSFLTGVTEPIEFTFLFLAPWLFWGFHAVMAAFSFLFMNLLGAHVGMTFSGGMIDSIIYGAIPLSQGTHFYWMYLIGAAYAPIYFFVFYWAIKKFDLATPGRGGQTALFSKADYKNSKISLGGTLKPQSAAIVLAAGGWDNITKFSNCATRLRYDIKDMSKVNKDALKVAGAAGVAPVGEKHVQIIMGPVAEQINTNIKSNIGVDLKDLASKEAGDKKNAKGAKASSKVSSLSVKSVADGTAASLASLKDGVFSEKMMGDGIVVKLSKTAKKASIFAPVSGELVTVFTTGHAYGIKTKEGVEVLIHIGIDTVNLKGKGFKSAVKQGTQVKAGTKLVDVDLAAIRSEVPSVDPIIIITSGQKVTKKASGKVTSNSDLFTVS